MLFILELWRFFISGQPSRKEGGIARQNIQCPKANLWKRRGAKSKGLSRKTRYGSRLPFFEAETNEQILRKKCDDVKTKLFAILLVLVLLIQSPVAVLAASVETLPEANESTEILNTNPASDSIDNDETTDLSGETTEPEETTPEETEATEATEATDPTGETIPVDVGGGSSSDVNQPSVGEQNPDTPVNPEIVNFELQLQNDFPVKKDLEEIRGLFLVTLHPAEPSVSEGEENHYDTVSTVENGVLVFRAANVPAGEYVVHMNAEYYFEDYQQKVTIDEGNKVTLVFSNSYASYRGDGKTSPGVYALGDVNSDGAINELDGKAILQYMSHTVSQPTASGTTETTSESTEPEVPEIPGEPAEQPTEDVEAIYDLNLDGKVDLVDLSILAYNMNREKREATPIITVLPSAVKVEQTQEKAQPQGERKLDTIMEDAAEPISIAPAKAEEPISEENPVEIALEIPNAPEVGGMVIAAPANSGPTGGTIKVETVNPADPEGAPIIMEVPIENEGDQEQPEEEVQQASMMRMARRSADGIMAVAAADTPSISSSAKAIRKADGSIVIDLGAQIAIKKVTIVVTKTATSTNLTEIAKVEFLNDMETRIPEPELNIPTDVEVTGSGDNITVTWKAETNVTGYEVAVSAISKDGKVFPEQFYKAGVNQIMISDFEGGHKDHITPLWTYYVRVKSTNGNWSSPYSEKVEHYQMAGKAPEPPDNLNATGKFRQINTSWKDMVGTEKYSLEYREKDSEGEWIEVHDIYTNAYNITGLKDDTRYEVRVYGWNHDDNDNWRRGGYSLPSVARTTSEVPKFPKYNMVPREEIEAIAAYSANIDATQYPADKPFNPEFFIDDDYTTYFHSTNGAGQGPIVTFKEEKTIKEIVVTNRMEDAYTIGWPFYYTIYINGWNAAGEQVVSNASYSFANLHPGAKNTIRLTLNEPITVKKLSVGFHRYYNAAVTISEIKYFEYDSLEDEVYGLYADDMHVTLKDTVTQEQIEALRERAMTKDENFDEYHPKKDLLLSELAYAEELLVNGASIDTSYQVKFDVTKNIGGSQFEGGLSGLQPLGYVAQSGNKINVYVGQKGKQLGQLTDVRLVFTQYHPESGAWRAGEIALVQGKNEIEVPNVSSLDFEHGGSLYVVHTNFNNLRNNPVQVRVSGATKIPKLDLHRSIGQSRKSVDEAAWKAAIRTYVEELVEYNRNLSANHEAHKEAVGGYEFGNGSNCFLNSTEIGLDNVLMSVPASQILNAIGGVNGDIDVMTDKLYGSMVAMNQMIELFYKERGFSPVAVNGARGIPTARFNIRYHRMFAGAFMYAGGLHLGIEWGSVPGLATGSPVITDENGKRIGGSMFGWGIAHEMGHNADGGGVAYAEVTNNIWSQFEKTWDSAATTRIPYAKVYDHVTSNTVGKANGVFAQLGMYWQLHLAYDEHYAHYDYYKDADGNRVFDDAHYQEMLAGEFFARYYLYRRDANAAPATTQTFSSVRNGTTDQNIMRTACAAAQKDLTDFFRAWGIVVDDVTANYASQFPKEERKIQYLNDGAHEYTLAGGAAMTSTAVEVALEQGVGANARKVTLTISLPTEANMDAILGYEIIRNGKPVAFVEPAMVTNEDGTTSYAATTVYTDVVETQNNRVMTYGVVAYDKYLNATAMTEMDPIKIRHEGDIPTDNWAIVSSNMVSDDGVISVYDGTKLVEGETYTDAKTGETVTYIKSMDVCYLDRDTGEVLRTESAAHLWFDGDENTTYIGHSASGNAQVVISLGGKQELMGIARPTNVASDLTRLWSFGLEFSNNGGASWTAIGAIQAITLEDGRSALMFKTDGNIRAITATHIRITGNRSNMLGFEELSLLGPTGDNVDIGISTIGEDGRETWNTDNAIGLLGEDYVLDAEANSVIPAGSFIVTGKYTGNAAYNVVKLYNQNHKMFDESFENKRDSIINGYQVFFADMPEAGNIVNVKDGFWVYWLEPLAGENEGKFGLPGAGENGEDLVVELPTKVYAELYRVDNAMTLAGERLVSDSFVVNVPEILPTIHLTNTAAES